MNRDNVGLSDIFDKHIKTVPQDIEELKMKMLIILSELKTNINHMKIFVDVFNTICQTGKYIIYCVNNTQNSFKYGILYKLGFTQIVDKNTITFVRPDIVDNVIPHLENYNYNPEIRTYFNKSL
jgi:hypothetical protein